MASNIQRGPNRMDSSDWTRMKRLNGAIGNMIYVASVTSPAPPRQFANVVNPAPIINPAVGRYTEFGLSKIQRPASSYTDYVASQRVTYVLQTPASTGQSLTAYAICNNCSTATNIVKHNGVCRACRYSSV